MENHILVKLRLHYSVTNKTEEELLTNLLEVTSSLQFMEESNYTVLLQPMYGPEPKQQSDQEPQQSQSPQQ